METRTNITTALLLIAVIFSATVAMPPRDIYQETAHHECCR